jgi:transcriptional regulator with XRE-family HTH domain
MDFLTTTAPIGTELRRWREHRTVSQLALAARAEVSTRHLSYVENGRSQPTAAMILRLAAALDVPMSEQNRLLLAGGFAPVHPERSLQDENLSVIMTGLRGLLDAHSPYPALLVDDHWDIVDANQAIDALLSGCAPELLEPPVNVIRVALHPQGLAPRIRNFGQWRAHLLHQLDQRIRRMCGDSRLEALRVEAAAFPDRGSPHKDPLEPVVLLELDSDDGPLRLFSVASRIEGPADVTLDSLHLETFLPADDDSRARLRSLRQWE